MNMCLWIDVPSKPAISKQCLEVLSLIYAVRGADPVPAFDDISNPRIVELYVVCSANVMYEIVLAQKRGETLRLGVINEQLNKTTGVLLSRCELSKQSVTRDGDRVGYLLHFYVFGDRAVFDILDGVATPRANRFRP